MVRVLELFAGEGGATRGLLDAGCEVVAVDSSYPRLRRNPSRHRVLGDAFEAGRALLAGGGFDWVWASPPCQRYSRGNAANDTSGYPDLIGPTRDMLLASGLPYVIENVEDARGYLRDPLMLCGTEFNLRAVDEDGEVLWLRRHRLFESSLPMWGAGGCQHPSDLRCGGVYGGARSDKREAREVRRGGYTPAGERVQSELLGVDWMTPVGRRLCIPPAYASFVAGEVAARLGLVAA